MIGILKEHGAGAPTAELCRRHGISEWTSSRWKRQYGGLEVGESRRLKALEAENARPAASAGPGRRRPDRTSDGAWTS